MITMHVAFARIKRNKIVEIAGESYLPADQVLDTIPQLPSEQQFLFGIYESDSMWTVLSINYLFACYDGSLSILQCDSQTQQLFDYFHDNDFASEAILNGRKIWLKSEGVAQVTLNAMLMLEKVPCGTVQTEK